MNFSTRLSQPGGASPYGRTSDFPTHTKRTVFSPGKQDGRMLSHTLFNLVHPRNILTTSLNYD